MTGTSETLRVVIVGHVDHGKSTLIGRLLLDTGSLPDGKREQLAAIAARRGVPLELANITDALQAERDQNVTIETSQIWFRSNRREYVLIDAPGHKEFVKNMVTGAASADAALVVIDAQEGVREQSRRHGRLLKLLGIDEILIVINKMDLVGYSQAEFERTVTDYRGFLSQLGLTPDAAVPISARCGDNIAVRSERMPWYSGPTIVEALDGIAGPPSNVDAPLRLAVQDVYRFDHRRILAGRVESGTLRVGDELLFLPSGKTSRVNTIERWNAPATGLAVAGDSIGVTLSDPLFLERGQIGAPAQNAPVLAREFGAQLFWLGRRPLRKGRPYKIKLATQEFDAEIVEVANVTDAATLVDCEGASAGAAAAEDVIDRNQVGRVTIRAPRPVVVDPFEHVPHLGRFVVVDELGVSGGGVVIGPRERSAPLAVSVASRNVSRSFGQVAHEERHTRNGHKGAVVWFTGLSGAGKSTLATALEHALFNRGWQPFVLDGDNVRLGLNADLGFSAQDRAENIRRVAEVAKLFAEAGMIAITAFISPYRSDRARARQIMQREGLSIPFIEVYVSTPLAICESRDPKGLYQRARDGKIESFTGISAPFEPPERPEVTIDTSATAVSEAVNHVLERLTPLIEL